MPQAMAEKESLSDPWTQRIWTRITNFSFITLRQIIYEV